MKVQEKINPIDVEAIMDGIRQEIKENGYEKEDLKFADIYVGEREGLELLGESFYIHNFSQAIVRMDGAKNVPCWRELTGNPLKVLFKKLVKKSIRCHLEPIVSDQNQFNQYTVSAMAQVFSKFAEDQDKRIEELEKQVEKLEKDCEYLRRQPGGE